MHELVATRLESHALSPPRLPSLCADALALLPGLVCLQASRTNYVYQQVWIVQGEAGASGYDTHSGMAAWRVCQLPSIAASNRCQHLGFRIAGALHTSS